MQMRFKAAALAAVGAFALYGCGQDETATTAQGSADADEITVVIGHVAPLTGNIAHLGKDNENGARLAVDDLNAQNLTIGGKRLRIEMLGEDDQADPKT